MSECRTCHQEIEWVMVAKSGRKMPIDPMPVETGNVVKLPTTDAETDLPLVEVVMAGGLLGDHRALYVSHFTTCPDADRHRRK